MADRTGQQFGIYQLTSLLAENALAEVYRGEQRYSHIDVAIKLLRHPLETTQEIDAFRGEARTLAALGNPHIARVLSFDVQNQVGYLVMDYVPGGTLRQRHPGGEALSLETILPSIKQVAEAVDYAHSQGVVHQALRPEKLLVGHQDEIVLAGFYLASAYPPAENETAAKPNRVSAYLAPEQLQQKPVPASDQYALGIIIYEWLSGAVPFQGSGVELAQHILKSAPPPLHRGALAVAPAVERVVMRALAKDPAKRFPSIQALADALEEASHAPAPQPTTAAAAVSASTPKQPAAAGHAPAPQAAAYPPAVQAHARTPQPTPQQAWQQRQQAPYQTPVQPAAWQRPAAPTRSVRSNNANTVGCLIALAIIVIVFVLILANIH
ncbi:MAG TPA: serine/threonine-protein kinase [Ktedonobacterales bacterium]|nr:serine/threonine-protein kinase [Ktedonobacterales bacterium]